ncbi:cytosolic thiouridylase subunit Ctu1 [Oleoguttula sp. CCFEE 5521]
MDAIITWVLPLKADKLGAHLQAYAETLDAIIALRLCYRFGTGPGVVLTNLPVELIKMIGRRVFRKSCKEKLPEWQLDFKCFENKCVGGMVSRMTRDEKLEMLQYCDPDCVGDWLDEEGLSGQAPSQNERILDMLLNEVGNANEIDYERDLRVHSDRKDGWASRTATLSRHREQLKKSFGVDLWASQVRLGIDKCNMFDEEEVVRTTVTYLTLPARPSRDFEWRLADSEVEYGPDVEDTRSGYGVPVDIRETPSKASLRRFARAVELLDLEVFVHPSQAGAPVGLLATKRKPNGRAGTAGECDAKLHPPFASPMAPRECEICHTNRAQILRPKNHARICAPCFTALFEQEVAETVESSKLFQHGERVAIGASGGKDSTVLASVLKTLNERQNWGVDLVLLSIDEGITGYRDHSLEAVKRNAADLDLPLKIVSYQELYGWSMDQVVAQIGKKGNCTYCGVFRRQALDRGAAMLGVGHVVTGHNADDVAETVLMNLLRGDLPRLSRATSLVTSTPSAAKAKSADGKVTITNVKRSKPMLYAYEKEIVMYAHHKKLDYFSTECIYSPEAFRGSARTLIKNLERIRPESILDVVKSGMDMARLVPQEQGAGPEEVEMTGGCGDAKESGGEMAAMERKLRQDEEADANGIETEVQLSRSNKSDHSNERSPTPEIVALTAARDDPDGQHHDRDQLAPVTLSTRAKKQKPVGRGADKRALPSKQKLGQCEKCGYLSSQAVCKACMLLEGLNKARPHTGIEVG